MKTPDPIHPARGLLKPLALAAIALAAAFPGPARAESLNTLNLYVPGTGANVGPDGTGLYTVFSPTGPLNDDVAVQQNFSVGGAPWNGDFGGAGTLTQTGGTITSSGGGYRVHIGWACQGTYNMSGTAHFIASYITAGANEGDGLPGTGMWSLTDTATASVGTLTLGQANTGIGRVSLAGSAQLTVTSSISFNSATASFISFVSGSAASLTLNGTHDFTALVSAGAIRVDGAQVSMSHFQESGNTLSLAPFDPNALDHFDITGISSPAAAGTAITGVTITAKKADDTTKMDFTGTVVFSGTAGITGTSDAFTTGELSGVSVTPTMAGSGMTLIVNATGATGTSTFDVDPGAADHLAFGVQPRNTAPGAAISPAVTVKVLDANGNTVNDTRSVTISSSTAALDGTSTLAVNAVAGVATFSNLKPTMLGSGHTLTASDGLLTPATSSSFTVAQPSDTVQWWYPSGTVTWTSTSGSYGNGLRTVTSEFNMGNGSYGAGTLNQTGGTITLQPGGSIGNGGYAGIYNMSGNACLISTTMSSGGNGTMTLTDNASAILSGALNFGSPGALFLSGAATFSAASLSGFNAANEYISFASGSTATLTVANKVLADYQTMVTSGYIRVDGVAQSDFSRFQVTGSTLSLIREPAYILSFGLPGNPAAIDHVNMTIAWTLPYGMSKTSLAPSYTLSSGTCVPASNPSPAVDFTNPVTYTVTDLGTSPTTTVREYVVTVTVASPTGILVGPSGSGTLTFDMLPPADQWSTFDIATGGSGTLFDAATMDTAAQALVASTISNALVTGGTGTNRLAQYNGQALYTRPTGGPAVVLMATLRNTTASSINGLTISYDYAMTDGGGEQVMGHRVYYSLTGLANSWTAIPALCSAMPGALTANVTLNSPWAAYRVMYVLWLDDNATSTEEINTIDNVSFTIHTPSGGYAAWAGTNGLSGNPNEDSNHDGVQNGIAYFMGATGPATNPGVGAGNTVTWINGGNIPSTAYGTQFVVETSTDLVNWAPVPNDSSDTNLSNTLGAVAYTLPSGEDKLFVRLVVTPN
ncbi:MAG: hypothetical protein NTW21_21320 [Verrucomicrobia bacterium]|nr:hypothetical protein [Verrucomicrobiota bacterium]